MSETFTLQSPSIGSPIVCHLCGGLATVVLMAEGFAHFARVSCKCRPSAAIWISKAIHERQIQLTIPSGDFDVSTATQNLPATQQATDDPWSMEASSGGGDYDFEPCAAGNYPGTIVGMFDVGLQDTNYNGEAKQTRQMMMAVELVKKKKDGSPFVLMQLFTKSFNNKAAFRKTVESITGKNFSEKEKFSPLSILGRPVMANVTNETKGDGDKARTYHKLSALAQFPDGFDPPKPIHEPIAWSIAHGKPFPAESLDWLPRWYGQTVEELVLDSDEARKRGWGKAGGADAKPKESEDSDIPF